MSFLVLFIMLSLSDHPSIIWSSEYKSRTGLPACIEVFSKVKKRYKWQKSALFHKLCSATLICTIASIVLVCLLLLLFSILASDPPFYLSLPLCVSSETHQQHCCSPFALCIEALICLPSRSSVYYTLKPHFTFIWPHTQNLVSDFMLCECVYMCIMSVPALVCVPA